jgi:hypothetical protein
VHTAIAPLSLLEPGRAFMVLLTFLIQLQNFLAVLLLIILLLGKTDPIILKSFTPKPKMNSLITNCLLMNNNSVAQAYLYALERMDMPKIINGLKRAINNPGVKHKIVLFEYENTRRDKEWKGKRRTQLQNGTYLDETFYVGLFQLLRQMFDMSLYEIEIYHRVKFNSKRTPVDHERQVVLSVGGGGGGGM